MTKSNNNKPMFNLSIASRDLQISIITYTHTPNALFTDNEFSTYANFLEKLTFLTLCIRG